MADYRIRPATLADIDVLVRHRIAMFTDMGTAMDADGMAQAFRQWLTRMMPPGTYQGWLVETLSGDVVAGGGITLLPWPPSPRDPAGDRIAFVYNVYTEGAHRRHGLARLVMETIHAWCRTEGIHAIALNASDDGRPLYEAMGYQTTPAPMMWCLIE
jgi:GNAT superfamily N-acetyltransferase